MRECAPQAISKRVSRGGDHAVDRFVDQQVEQRVVRSRNGPTQTRLQRPSRLLRGKMSGLPQQIAVEAHIAYAGSESARNRTYTHTSEPVSCRTKSTTESRTDSRTMARVLASTSCSRVTHTHTAGSSVASGPASTCHELTVVGRFGRVSWFSSADLMLVAIEVISKAYQRLPGDLQCSGVAATPHQYGRASAPVTKRMKGVGWVHSASRRAGKSSAVIDSGSSSALT